MLSKVSGNNQDEFIKSIEIGDLSMRTNNIPIDYSEQPEVPKYPDSPPESCFTTPWLISDRGLFRVYVAIIRPQSEQAKYDLTLGSSKAEHVIEAIPDIVEFLENKPRRYNPVSM